MRNYHFILLSLSVFFLTACFGPLPQVQEKSFVKSSLHPGYYEVRLVIENKASGEGDIEVVASLKDPQSDLVYRQEKTLEIEPHEKLVVELLVRAPENIHSQYELQTKVQYPPQ